MTADPETQTPAIPSAPWQASLWAHARQAIGDQRLAHGLLICGPPGVGKRQFAERIVGALLCHRPTAEGACGECPGCRQRLARTHPDISYLSADEPGRMIKIERVRAFAQRLQLTPQYDSGRVGVIDPAEDLSRAAANSLLKTLEEPPAGCHILLVTDRVSSLMATIRSRCQLWRVPAAEIETGRAWLAGQGIDTDGLDTDSLRTPFRWLQSGFAEAERDSARRDADLAAVMRNRADISRVAGEWKQLDTDLLLDWLYRRTAAMLALALDGQSPESGLPSALAEIAGRIDAAVFAPWARELARAAELSQGNADWTLVLESLLLRLRRHVRARRVDAPSA